MKRKKNHGGHGGKRRKIHTLQQCQGIRGVLFTSDGQNTTKQEEAGRGLSVLIEDILKEFPAVEGKETDQGKGAEEKETDQEETEGKETEGKETDQEEKEGKQETKTFALETLESGVPGWIFIKVSDSPISMMDLVKKILIRMSTKVETRHVEKIFPIDSVFKMDSGHFKRFVPPLIKTFFKECPTDHPLNILRYRFLIKKKGSREKTNTVFRLMDGVIPGQHVFSLNDPQVVIFIILLQKRCCFGITSEYQQHWEFNSRKATELAVQKELETFNSDARIDLNILQSDQTTQETKPQTEETTNQQENKPKASKKKKKKIHIGGIRLF